MIAEGCLRTDALFNDGFHKSTVDAYLPCRFSPYYNTSYAIRCFDVVLNDKPTGIGHFCGVFCRATLQCSGHGARPLCLNATAHCLWFRRGGTRRVTIIVDLIDSLIVHERFRHLGAVHDKLKNELHALVRLDPLSYFRLLQTFDYPCVSVERVPEFVRAVRAFLFRKGFVFRNFATMTLCDLLQDAADDTTLDFLVGNDSGVLVDSFDTVFLNRLATFTNAVHVFDEEPQIRARLEQRRIVCRDQPIMYRFANSRSEPAIQVSDVLCGILGKHFSCMEKLSIEQLESWKMNLSGQQRRNVALLAKFTDKADEECPALIFNQAPNDSKAKSLWFLHGIEYPEDYRDC